MNDKTQQQTDRDRADTERVMASEKNLVMLEALKVRVKHHSDGFLMAKTRIDACYELAGRAPKEADVLRGVIKTWERIREYHARVLTESRQLGAEIARTLPDPPPGS